MSPSRDRALLPALLGALALVLGGCGSSSGTTTTSTTAASGGTAVGGSSLKVQTTPRFGSPAASSPVQSGTVHVAYRYITIRPDTLRVRKGTTIVWTNYDNVEHNVTSEGGPAHFSSGNFGEGAGFTVRLTRPGIVHYECTNHPASMNGTIEVVS